MRELQARKTTKAHRKPIFLIKFFSNSSVQHKNRLFIPFDSRKNERSFFYTTAVVWMTGMTVASMSNGKMWNIFHSFRKLERRPSSFVKYQQKATIKGEARTTSSIDIKHEINIKTVSFFGCLPSLLGRCEAKNYTEKSREWMRESQHNLCKLERTNTFSDSALTSDRIVAKLISNEEFFLWNDVPCRLGSFLLCWRNFLGAKTLIILLLIQCIDTTINSSLPSQFTESKRLVQLWGSPSFSHTQVFCFFFPLLCVSINRENWEFCVEGLRSGRVEEEKKLTSKVEV